MIARWLGLLSWLLLALAGQGGLSAGQAEHVVVLVWDGLRPEYVTSQYAPTLADLARRGVFFKNHHSAYITSTEVNGAALATGMHPDHDGIIANTEYRPDLSWLSACGTDGLDVIRRGDFLTGGQYLQAATVAEILQEAGFPTLIAGAKPLALLHDRSANKTSDAQKRSVTLFRGQTLPRAVAKSLVEIPEIGPFPTEPGTPDSSAGRVSKWLRSAQNEIFNFLYGKPKTPAIARLIDAWTTKALVYGLWKESVPKYSLLWLSEPDSSQHKSGVGSPNAEAGLEQCDQNLTLVLKTLELKGLLDRTDVFVVSDHGFSTIDRGPDVIKSLKRAGFTAAKQFDNPEPGDVMVLSLGGSTFFYVFNHDEPTIRRLIEYLQTSDWAGVIFSQRTVEGTFPLAQVHLDAERGAPDVVVSMRWRADPNEWGAPGLIPSPDGTPGRGTHASLSRFDLHNTLIAAGPDFRQGSVNELPSGNVDLAPTILAILGVTPPRPMDGRVLTEAFTGDQPATPKPEPQTTEATRDLGFRLWHQYLKLTHVGSVVYFDEGNGESRLK